MLSYRLNKSSYTVTGIGDETEDIIVPLTYDGLPVTKIAKRAFCGNERIKSVVIGDNVTAIGKEAFACSNLKIITIGKKVKVIEGKAFWFCPDLEVVFWNAEECTKAFTFGIDKNGEDGIYLALAHCEKLRAVVFGEGVRVIPNNALLCCESIKSIFVPASVTEIGRYAIGSCPNLTEITFGGTKEKWQAIDKIPLWDECTRNYTVYCTDGKIERL